VVGTGELWWTGWAGKMRGCRLSASLVHGTESREFNLLSSVEASSKAQAKGVRDCVQLLW